MKVDSKNGHLTFWHRSSLALSELKPHLSSPKSVTIVAGRYLSAGGARIFTNGADESAQLNRFRCWFASKKHGQEVEQIDCDVQTSIIWSYFT